MRKLVKIAIFALVVMALACMLTMCVSAKNYVADFEGVLSTYQEQELQNELERISQAYQCDMVFLTTSSFNGKTAQRYAESYYDRYGYGYDSEGTGVIYLLSVEQREYYIFTTGKAVKIFKGNRMDYLENSILICLQNDDFDGSAFAYASKVSEILENYESSAVDTETLKNGILISVVIAVVIAIIAVLIMRAKMNNSKPQKTAGYYMRNGSFCLTVSRDMYLYSTTIRVARPKSNSSGGSRGGGARGGRGGRF